MYQTLLKPAGLACLYYYPFGTTQNLSIGEIQPWSDTHHHALFHFDQEPIYNTFLGKLYDELEIAHFQNYCKLLANSEHSSIKKKICQERGMLDWYFFYHGFAALDWFRDSRYFDQVQIPKKTYASYNHIVTGKRSYRLSLTCRLHQKNLIEHGDISFHGTPDQCINEIESNTSEIEDLERDTINTMIRSGFFKPPIYLDCKDIDGTWSARLGYHEYRLWQNCFWHLVNETVFYDDKLHLTEKIFKPIVASRPFILVSAPGSLAYLRQYGFQTFGSYIDESYDSEPNATKRLDMIADQIEKLCSLGSGALNDMFCDMQSILQHNRQHFFNDFHRIIVEELVENFDHCINIWNNGRVDGRQRSNLKNKHQIKQWLLQ